MFLKCSFCITGLTIFCITAFTTLAFADPPKRVLRLSAIEGESSFMPAGTNDWVIATVNRPLITGDSLWNDQKTQSALQMGDATICLGENSSLSILNLDDEIAQVKLSEGILNLRIKQLTENQIYEIDTPNLAFMATQPGYYRITVNSQDNSTTVDVREGEGDVYGEENAYVMNANQAYQFTGTDLKDYEELNIAPNDQLDEWCAAYLPQPKAGASSQYVSPLVIGHEDLDRYGKWEQVEEYGYVWRPAEIEEDWAPYRVGHWVWIEPWGWNWIGEEPWGFAPYHYGRWAFIGDHWCWVPGPISVYPVYAPALVAFVGGDGFDLSVIGADIAWFPLGPGDIYWPPFAYSKNYFSFINLSAPLITETLVVKAYHNKAFKLPYRNFKVANAITAVPKQAFVGSKQISKANVKIASDKLAKAPIKQGTAAKFSKESILGTSQKAKNIPNEKVFSRRVITKSAISDKTGKLKQETLSSKAKKPQPLSRGTQQIDMRGKRPAKEKQTPLKEIQQGKEKRLEQQQRQLQRQELQQRRQLQPQEQQQLQGQQLKQQRQQERQELQKQRQLQRQENQQLQRQQLQQQRLQERQELQQQRQLQRQELQKQQRQLQRQENQQLQRQQLQQQRQQERQELQQQRQLQRQQLQQQHQQERHELQQQRQQYLQEQLQQRQQQLQQREQTQQPRQQMQQQIEEEIKKRKGKGQQN